MCNSGISLSPPCGAAVYTFSLCVYINAPLRKELRVSSWSPGIKENVDFSDQFPEELKVRVALYNSALQTM